MKIKTLIAIGLTGIGAVTFALMRTPTAENQHKNEIYQARLLNNDDRRFLQKTAKESSQADDVDSIILGKLVYLNSVLDQIESESVRNQNVLQTRNITRLKSIAEDLSFYEEKAKNKEINTRTNTAIRRIMAFKSQNTLKELVGQLREDVGIKFKQSEVASYGSRISIDGIDLPIKKIPGGFGKGYGHSFALLGFDDKAQTDTISCTHQDFPDPAQYGDSLNGSDIYTGRTGDVVELAQKLQTASTAFSYVRDNIRFISLFGAAQSAAQVIRSQAGGAADKVTLLVALLRAMNIPAVYQMGEVMVEEEKLKRIYEVEGLYDLAWAHYRFHYQYFGKNIAPADVFKVFVNFRNGKKVWPLPHVWARAYINGQWITLDPLNDNNGSQTSSPLLRELPITQYYVSWLFDVDNLGRYIKPGGFIDDLMRKAGSAIREQAGNGETISDIGWRSVKRNLPETHDSIASGSIGEGDACIEAQSATVPEQYRFISKIVVGPEISPVLSYQSPTAQWRNEVVTLTHSAGLLGDSGNGKPGNLEVRVGDAVVASASMTSGSEIEIRHTMLEPARYRTLQAPMKLLGDRNLSGGTYVFNHALAPVVDADIHELVQEIRNQTGQGASRQTQMVLLLRIAGMLAMTQQNKEANEAEKLFGVKQNNYHLLNTKTVNGIISDKNDRILGFIPLGSTIDWVGGGGLYSKVGNKTFLADYKNTANSTNATLLAGSALEHQIWEELYGIPALSAVKIIQTANKMNIDGNLGWDFIRGEQLGVGNDAAIFNRFQESVKPYIAQINKPEYVDKKSTLYSITNKLSLPSGWSGIGWVILQSNLLGGAVATFGTITPGVTSLGGGTEGSPKNTEKPEDGNGFGSPANTTGESSCNPVNYASGTMWHAFTDFSLRGRTPYTDLGFQRTYLTKPYSVTGDLGSNWVHNWDTRLISENSQTLIPNGMGNIFWIDETGGEFLFKRNPVPNNNTFVTPNGFFFTLAETAPIALVV